MYGNVFEAQISRHRHKHTKDIKRHLCKHTATLRPHCAHTAALQPAWARARTLPSRSPLRARTATRGRTHPRWTPSLPSLPSLRPVRFPWAGPDRGKWAMWKPLESRCGVDSSRRSWTSPGRGREDSTPLPEDRPNTGASLAEHMASPGSNVRTGS